MSTNTESETVALHHSQSSGRHELASDAELLTGTLEQARGLIGRPSLADDACVVFDWAGESSRLIHTVGVRFDLDVIWLVDDSVMKIERLPSWTGWSVGTADRVIELPAGQGDGIEIGDTIRVLKLIE
jgi:hypothetical protein